LARGNDRAEWAHAAIDVFEHRTGSEREESLGDLLADLMHWCDRNNQDFEIALDRARYHYAEETGTELHFTAQQHKENDQ
jgi:hypothetical protein